MLHVFEQIMADADTDNIWACISVLSGNFTLISLAG